MGARPNSLESRRQRAERWEAKARTPIGTVEPEWWLRMVCGQVAEEDFPDWAGEVSRVARHRRGLFGFVFALASDVRARWSRP